MASSICSLGMARLCGFRVILVSSLTTTYTLVEFRSLLEPTWRRHGADLLLVLQQLTEISERAVGGGVSLVR